MQKCTQYMLQPGKLFDNGKAWLWMRTLTATKSAKPLFLSVRLYFKLYSTTNFMRLPYFVWRLLKMLLYFL